MREKLDAAIQSFLKDIAEKRENYCKAWLDETGLLPSEAVLLQKDNKFWIEKKSADELAIERLRLWNKIEAYPFSSLGWGLRVLACNAYNTQVLTVRGKFGHFGPSFISDSGEPKMVTHWTYLPPAETTI